MTVGSNVQISVDEYLYGGQSCLYDNTAEYTGNQTLTKNLFYKKYTFEKSYWQKLEMESGTAPPAGELCKVNFKLSLFNCTDNVECNTEAKTLAFYGYRDYTI